VSKPGHLTSALALGATLVALKPTPATAITALVIVFAANLPDQLEFVSGFGPDGTRYSLIPHRTLTHWPAIWLALLVAAVCDTQWVVLHALGYAVSLGAVVAGLALGALLHCFLDVFSPMGIPLVLPFGKRFSVRRQRVNAYRTGDAMESLVVASLVGVALFAVGVRVAGHVPDFIRAVNVG
jgi:membrane-bound metal-dependent hydrolase YbcI (DUF457 family)